MRLSKRIVFYGCLAAFVASHSCRARHPNQEDPSSEILAQGGGLVVIQCLAPQGNGGNWASTLGWISELWMIRANQAEKSGNAGVYLGCITGGSSGSIVANVVGAVLSNGSLVSGASAEKIYSPPEVRVLARTIRTIALGADLDLKEWVLLMTQVVGKLPQKGIEQTLEIIKNNSFLKSKLEGRQTSLNWWNGSTVNPKAMLIDFSTSLLFGRTVSEDFVDVKLSSEPKLSAFLPKLNQLNLVDRPEFISDWLRMNLNNITSKSNLEDFLTAQSDLVDKRVDVWNTKHFESKGFSSSDYKNRNFLNLFSDASQKSGSRVNPIVEVLERPLPTGVCTTTMGYFDDKPATNPAPDYKDLRVFVICNENTAQRILNSKIYRAHLNSSDAQLKDLVGRFVIFSTPTGRGSMYVSIQEPFLMNEVHGKPMEGPLELQRYFDPREGHSFELKSTAGKFVAIAGGWPDRRVAAWTLSYHAIETYERLQKEGKKVSLNLDLFGKPDSSTTDTFALKVIKEVFNTSGQKEKNVADWKTFQKTFCTQFETLFRERGGRVGTVTYNWDIASLPIVGNTVPAAQFWQSRLVAVGGANATRRQLSDLVPTENREVLYFDPKIELNQESLQKNSSPCFSN